MDFISYNPAGGVHFVPLVLVSMIMGPFLAGLLVSLVVWTAYHGFRFILGVLSGIYHSVKDVGRMVGGLLVGGAAKSGISAAGRTFGREFGSRVGRKAARRAMRRFL